MALTVQAAHAQITFTKEFLNDPVMPGDTVTLRFTITNPVNVNYTVGTFQDDLNTVVPGLVRTSTLSINGCGAATVAGTSVISVNGITIIGIGACTIDVALAVPANAPAGNHLNVTSTLIGLFDGEGLNVPGARDMLMVNVGETTSTMINAFLHRRANMLLEEEPDRTRLFRRLPGSLWDGSGAASFAGGPTFDRPMSLAVRERDGETQVDFASSLSRIAHSLEAVRRRTERDAMRGLALDEADAALISPTTTGYGFDVWVEGHFRAFQSDLGNVEHDGHFGIIYVGADYRVATSVIIGALVQFDWIEDNMKDTSMGVDGHGWMAGPYLSARLSEHLFFMVRGAWGQSDNTIQPFGTFADKFHTNRWLVTANLAGNWTHGDVRITPNLWLKYIEETQDSFTGSMGMTILSQSVSLGRFSFGPEFGYRHVAADGTIIEPHGSIIGIWDFDAPDTLTVMRFSGTGANAAIPGSTVTGIDDFRAKVEGGLSITNPSGTTLRIVGSYDGIGSDDLETIGAQATLSVPLN